MLSGSRNVIIEFDVYVAAPPARRDRPATGRRPQGGRGQPGHPPNVVGWTNRVRSSRLRAR